MSDIAIEFNHVWKKFKRGEKYDSLRDLIPAMVKRVFSRNSRQRELEERKFWALKDVNFEVKKGEVLGIIGPNGAGKSTILKVISKILKPNRGFVKTRGRICTLIEIGAGFHPDLTGRENIYLNGAILGMKKKEIDRKFEEIVEFSGIKDFIDTPIKRYSSGMAARLGFAVAAHLDPEILLVDEVLSVGDAPFRAKCIRRMSELMRGDVAVVFVSHNMEFIRQLCSKCIVLDRGNIAFTGETEKAIEHYIRIIQKGRSTYQTNERLRHDLGHLLGLKIIDKHGQITNQVECFDPVTLIIEYELYKKVSEVAFGISFSLPYGAWVANCNTIRDRLKINPKPGKGSVKLYIECMNLSPADYDITVRFMEPTLGEAIDHHHCQYKLIVGGEPHPGHWVQLKHNWVLE